jgi:hypothetical protein
MIHQPQDVALSLQLAFFMWRVPAQLERMPLPQLLETLRAARRPPASSPHASLERLLRLSRPWLKRTPLRSRNTCYVRALLFYRFLDPQDAPLQIHFVVEPGRTRGDRLHGHAWVTVGEAVIEPPLPEVMSRSRGIYTFPPA